MFSLKLRHAAAGVLLTTMSLGVQAQVTFNLDASHRGPAIGDLHYGIFYEEINNAGDGGIYAELVRNRSFEDGLSYWSVVGSGTVNSIITSDLMNDAQTKALEVKLGGASHGIANAGYWGMKSVAGDKYTFTCWAKAPAGYTGTITPRLVDNKGNVLGESTITGVSLGNQWVKLTTTITPTVSSDDARFQLIFSNSGTVQLDMVSIFPPTFKDRPNGCRRDLAEMLAAMKPAFVRFPGGCYIEGDGSVEDNRRFEWKKTIGPVEERPGHFNYNWGYPCTDGMGFHEFLQLTEDLGAEPLFVVNIGIGHGWFTDYTKIDNYIQEALDALEYCNGDVTTTWGAKRAANGHPEPFNMRLLEIGNENYNFDDDRSDHYAERYKAFYDAIKAQYPEVTLIGNVEAWGTDEPSWRNSNPCEIVDEHYYRDPQWFINCYGKYDRYDRSKPKVYVGEYAVTNNFGTNGHLQAALGEAVYMLGMEKNSDVCIMNSYAPIFMNEERGGGWMPDMIRFNHANAYGTPSYWVQQLLPNNHGPRNLVWTEDNNITMGGNKIALSSWKTQLKYDNVKVTDLNGNVLFTEDFTDNSKGLWTLPTSYWKIADGVLRQSSSSEEGRLASCSKELPGSYILEVDATKISGAEGFLVGFNYGDNSNYCWWNIGGWDNSKHGLQVCKNGGKSDYSLTPGTIETGRTYRVKIVVDGSNVQCYLDGNLIHDMSLPIERKVYASAQIDDESKEMIVKLVNPSSTACYITFNLANAGYSSATCTILSSASDKDENTTANPLNVAPREGTAPAINGAKATYTAPAYSLSILRFSLSNINYQENPGQQAPEEMVNAIKEELAPAALKLNFLHASTALPVTTTSGATVEWSMKEPSAYIAVSASRFSNVLDVLKTNDSDKKINAGTLLASVTFPDGSRCSIEYPVTLAPSEKDLVGYLYAFMNPNTEQTNFALASRESKGKRFRTLLQGNEAFDTEALAPIEHGTRDPYLGRGNGDNEYFMTTTDMSQIRSGWWSNHGLDLLRSTDLVHWESTAFDFRLGKKIFSDPEVTVEDGFRTDAEYAKMTQVWAPQFIWDPEAYDGKGAYMVYYSLLADGQPYSSIYYSYTDDKFKTLTQPRLLYAPKYAVIDTDILYNDYDGLYHIMIKKEGTVPGIFEYTTPSLHDSNWTEVMHMQAEGNAAVEGPTTIRRIDEDVHNLYYMRYDAEYKYKVVDLDHLCLNYGASNALTGDGAFQHGSIIKVFEPEYRVLNLWSELDSLMRKARLTIAANPTDIFDEPMAQAQSLLDNNRTVDDLNIALPQAIDLMTKAHNDYLVATPDAWNDVTDRIKNPDFNKNNGDGWTGTVFTATGAGVAEQWNKTYDTYQILKNMPAGLYRLEVQGFYRYGYQAESRKAHEDGTEQLLAHYYMNDSEGTFTSLYDTGFSSVPDNVDQSNTAFNRDNRYHNEPIMLTLNEEGSIRIGVRKSVAVNGDWNCFDNFKLYYKPVDAGIDEVTVGNGADDLVDVVTPAGVVLRHDVRRAEALDGLPAGFYIVGNEKVAHK